MNKYWNLNKGDEIRVIAPSRNLNLIGKPNTDLAIKVLEEMGFKVTFGKNVYENGRRFSSSIESRVNDIHEAYQDKNVKLILTVIGGFNSNQLLPYLDWSLIKNNPKPLCGFSDITALIVSIYAKTQNINFYGPHFSSFAMIQNSEFIKQQFKEMFLETDEPFKMKESDKWSDDMWFLDQENRVFEQNTKRFVINPGIAQGKLFGGNLSTIALIRDTEYWPDLNDDMIFFTESVSAYSYDEFERMLVSLTQSKWFKNVKALMIGRMQNGSKLSLEEIKEIIDNIDVLKNIPVIANLDFGHTMPLSILPVGLEAKLDTSKEDFLIVER
ncbi:S66 family peptidase [Mycoplasma sp. 1573]